MQYQKLESDYGKEEGQERGDKRNVRVEMMKYLVVFVMRFTDCSREGWRLAWLTTGYLALGWLSVVMMRLPSAFPTSNLTKLCSIFGLVYMYDE